MSKCSSWGSSTWWQHAQCLGEQSQHVYTLFHEESSSYTHRPLHSALPILLAFITSLINNVSMFDEGSGSGAYLWLLMGSVPIGLLLVVIGAIVALFKRLKPKGQL